MLSTIVLSTLPGSIMQRIFSINLPLAYCCPCSDFFFVLEKKKKKEKKRNEKVLGKTSFAASLFFSQGKMKKLSILVKFTTKYSKSILSF